MKNLKDIITEKLKLNKNLEINTLRYFPETRKELRKILIERLDKDKDANLNDIDVRDITDLGDDENGRGLFEGLDPHNIKIDKWDVSTAKTMKGMFAMCNNFNCDLSKWDVSNVEDMSWMFYGCRKFNSDLSNWNTINLKNMTRMFYYCKNLKCDFNKWNVNNVTNMKYAFAATKIQSKPPKWYK